MKKEFDTILIWYCVKKKNETTEMLNSIILYSSKNCVAKLVNFTNLEIRKEVFGKCLFGHMNVRKKCVATFQSQV